MSEITYNMSFLKAHLTCEKFAKTSYSVGDRKNLKKVFTFYIGYLRKSLVSKAVKHVIVKLYLIYPVFRNETASKRTLCRLFEYISLNVCSRQLRQKRRKKIK